MRQSLPKHGRLCFFVKIARKRAWQGRSRRGQIKFISGFCKGGEPALGSENPDPRRRTTISHLGSLAHGLAYSRQGRLIAQTPKARREETT